MRKRVKKWIVSSTPMLIATMAITIDGSPIPLDSFVAYAGPSDDVADQSVIYLLAEETAGGRTAIAYVALPDDMVAPGEIEVGAPGVESGAVARPRERDDSRAGPAFTGPPGRVGRAFRFPCSRSPTR